MNRSANKFEELVQQVQEFNNFPLIFATQLQKYDLQPYKIEQCSAIAFLKMYQNIHNKYKYDRFRYKMTGELSIDQNGWNENERRLFVWFIISYMYFQELNNQQISQHLWQELSPVFFDKKPQFLEFQYLNLLVSKKRIAWTEEEDQLLVEIIKQQKPGKWNEISKNMFYVSSGAIFRSPKHCRERWLNHLDSNKKHGSWTETQDYAIFKYVCENGKRWSKIVPLLNETRTEHMIKNRYNSLVSKNKANKKQKEEDIAKRLLKELARSVEIEPIESRSPTLKQELTAIEGKSEEIGSIQQSHQIQPQNQQVKQYAPVSYPNPNAYNYGCFIDYNTLFLINQFYCSSNLPSMPTFALAKEQQLFCSKNSSFTLYQPAN